MQRLGLGGGDDHLDPADSPDHARNPLPPVTPVEVAAHAGTKRLRLADVEDVVGLVAKEVDTGAARKCCQLLTDRFDHAV